MASGYLLTGHLKSIHIKGNDLLPFFVLSLLREIFSRSICSKVYLLYLNFFCICILISHFLDTAFSVYRKSTVLRSIWQSTIYLLYFCWQVPSFYIQDIQGSELNRKRLFMSADKPFRPASEVTISLHLIFFLQYSIYVKKCLFFDCKK